MASFDRWVETARKSNRGERTDTVLVARQTFNELKSDRHFSWLKRYIERKMPNAEIHEVSSTGGTNAEMAILGNDFVKNSNSNCSSSNNNSSGSLGTLDGKTVFHLLMMSDPTDVPSRITHTAQLLGNDLGNVPIETIGLLLLANIAAKCVSLGDFASAFEAPLRRFLISLLERRKWLPNENSIGVGGVGGSSGSGLFTKRNSGDFNKSSSSYGGSIHHHQPQFSIMRHVQRSGRSSLQQNSITSNPTTVRGVVPTNITTCSRSPPASPKAGGGGFRSPPTSPPNRGAPGGGVVGSGSFLFTSAARRDSAWSGAGSSLHDVSGGATSSSRSTHRAPVATLPQSKSWVVEQLGLQRAAMLAAEHEDPAIGVSGGGGGGSYNQVNSNNSVETPAINGFNHPGPSPSLGDTLGHHSHHNDSFTPDDHALGAPSRVTVPDMAPLDPQRTAGPMSSLLGSDCESNGTTEVAVLPSAFRITASYSSSAACMREALRLLVALITRLPEAAAEKLLEQAMEHVPEFPSNTEEEADSIVTIALSFSLVTVVCNHIDVHGAVWEPPTPVRGGGGGGGAFILSSGTGGLDGDRKSSVASNGTAPRKNSSVSITGPTSPDNYGLESSHRHSSPMMMMPSVIQQQNVGAGEGGGARKNSGADHLVVNGEATKQDLTTTNNNTLTMQKRGGLVVSPTASTDGSEGGFDMSIGLGNAEALAAAYVMTSFSVKAMFGIGAAGSSGGGTGTVGTGGGGPGDVSMENIPGSARSGLLPQQPPTGNVPPKGCLLGETPTSSPTAATGAWVSSTKNSTGRRNTMPTSTQPPAAAVLEEKQYLGSSLGRTGGSKTSSLLIAGSSPDRARRSSVVPHLPPPSTSIRSMSISEGSGSSPSLLDRTKGPEPGEDDSLRTEAHDGDNELLKPTMMMSMDFETPDGEKGGRNLESRRTSSRRTSDFSDAEDYAGSSPDLSAVAHRRSSKYQTDLTEGGPQYDESDDGGVTAPPAAVVRRTTAQGNEGCGAGCCSVM